MKKFCQKLQHVALELFQGTVKAVDIHSQEKGYAFSSNRLTSTSRQRRFHHPLWVGMHASRSFQAVDPDAYGRRAVMTLTTIRLSTLMSFQLQTSLCLLGSLLVGRVPKPQTLNNAKCLHDPSWLMTETSSSPAAWQLNRLRTLGGADRSLRTDSGIL